MEYVQDYDPAKLNDLGLTDMLVHSRVRGLLEAWGYRTVTFANVHWDFSDADVFLDFPNPFLSPFLQPIEGLIMENSLMRALTDADRPCATCWPASSNSPVRNHYQQQLSIINRLPMQKMLKDPNLSLYILKNHMDLLYLTKMAACKRGCLLPRCLLLRHQPQVF